MGHSSLFFRLFFGTRSSSRNPNNLGLVASFIFPGYRLPFAELLPSKNASPTPCTSLGGLSASASRLSISVSNKLPPPSCLILRNASDKVMKRARMSPGMGVALLFCVVEVLTSSRLEKKVERSGRRVCCWVEASFLGILCSTGKGGRES